MVQLVSPIRAWGRRAVHGLRVRPDVQIGRLERRLQVLEQLVELQTSSAHWVAQFKDLLQPQQVVNMPLARFGSANDGGYVLPANIRGLVTGVVSIGVGDNIDADLDLANLGLHVHAWDHTVSGLPSPHERITFHPQGLGVHSTHESLLPLDEIVDNSFGTEGSGLLLLLDAEGAEWQALASATSDTLDRFAVISMELHDLGELIIEASPKLAALANLNSRFVPVAIHANNYCAEWHLPHLTLPDVLEITYVNRQLSRGETTPGNCPSDLLAPCCPDIPEMSLSWLAQTDN